MSFLRGHLWDKFSHWDLELVNWLDWLMTEPQGSSCILFPAWDYRCMGIKTKSLCLRDKHFINWAISPTPRTLDFLKPYRCAPDFYMTCKALTAYPTIFLKKLLHSFTFYACVLQSKGIMEEWVLSFQHVGPKDQTQVIRLSSKCLYLLSHLDDPTWWF